MTKLRVCCLRCQKEWKEHALAREHADEVNRTCPWPSLTGGDCGGHLRIAAVGHGRWMPNEV